MASKRTEKSKEKWWVLILCVVVSVLLLALCCKCCAASAKTNFSELVNESVMTLSGAVAVVTEEVSVKTTVVEGTPGNQES